MNWINQAAQFVVQGATHAAKHHIVHAVTKEGPKVVEHVIRETPKAIQSASKATSDAATNGFKAVINAEIAVDKAAKNIERTAKHIANETSYIAEGAAKVAQGVVSDRVSVAQATHSFQTIAGLNRDPITGKRVSRVEPLDTMPRRIQERRAIDQIRSNRDYIK